MGESLMLQGGALAILGWAVWYVLAKALPREREEFLAANKEIRQEYHDSLHALSESINCLSAAISGKLPATKENS